ncbi:MAG: carbohydrate ABC transporter permease [Christensenellales bacterium]
MEKTKTAANNFIKSAWKRFTSRKSRGDVVLDIALIVIISLISVLLVYPFLYMVSVSLSDYDKVVDVVLFPKGISFGAYVKIFSMNTVLRGYLNSAIYTLTGLVVSMALTILAAYPLSKNWLPGRKVLSIIVLITMYFGGGLIPSYLLVTKYLGWKNNMLSIIIPGALNTYYMIIMRTFFVTGVPKAIEEAAQIDGATEMQTLIRIFLPLSTPIMATIGLYYFVVMWNSWFSASIYLDESSKYPIQLILRNALSSSNIWVGDQSSGDINYKSMDYALTISVVLPIIFIYPFCQKYFIKGVMVGSLKG